MFRTFQGLYEPVALVQAVVRAFEARPLTRWKQAESAVEAVFLQRGPFLLLLAHSLPEPTGLEDGSARPGSVRERACGLSAGVLASDDATRGRWRGPSTRAAQLVSCSTGSDDPASWRAWRGGSGNPTRCRRNRRPRSALLASPSICPRAFLQLSQATTLWKIKLNCTDELGRRTARRAAAAD